MVWLLVNSYSSTLFPLRLGKGGGVGFFNYVFIFHWNIIHSLASVEWGWVNFFLLFSLLGGSQILCLSPVLENNFFLRWMMIIWKIHGLTGLTWNTASLYMSWILLAIFSKSEFFLSLYSWTLLYKVPQIFPVFHCLWSSKKRNSSIKIACCLFYFLC